jgi:glutamyl-tRNA synthetase
MRVLVEQLGFSPNQVFGILRAAITGQTVSPPLFDSMEIVGKEKVMERIKNAMDILEKI